MPLLSTNTQTSTSCYRPRKRKNLDWTQHKRSLDYQYRVYSGFRRPGSWFKGSSTITTKRARHNTSCRNGQKHNNKKIQRTQQTVPPRVCTASAPNHVYTPPPQQASKQASRSISRPRLPWLPAPRTPLSSRRACSGSCPGLPHVPSWRRSSSRAMPWRVAAPGAACPSSPHPLAARLPVVIVDRVCVRACVCMAYRYLRLGFLLSYIVRVLNFHHVALRGRIERHGDARHMRWHGDVKKHSRKQQHKIRT